MLSRGTAVPFAFSGSSCVCTFRQGDGHKMLRGWTCLWLCPVRLGKPEDMQVVSAKDVSSRITSPGVEGGTQVSDHSGKCLP